MDLEELDPSEVEDIPCRGRMIKAKVIDIYDGDTVTVIYEIRDGVCFKAKIRVEGIDTPEIKPKKKTSDYIELERQAAEKIKNLVEKKIRGKVVYVCLLSHDKYGGRYIGNVYLGTTSRSRSLSDFLLEKRYARKYNGEAKKKWTKEELEYIVQN